LKRLIATTLTTAAVAVLAIAVVGAGGTGTASSKSSTQTKSAAPAAKPKPAAKVDINTASKDDLVKAGFTADTADKVIAGRPYKSTQDLVTKKIVDAATLKKLSTKITVPVAKKAPAKK